MRTTVGFCVAAAACLTLGAGPLRAQGPQTRTDSLEQLVRALSARLDSLEAVLEQLRIQGPGVRAQQRVRGGRDTAQVLDEIAALRAAARSMVPEQAADTAPEKFVLKSRNLNDFNPEISVTGDVRLTGNRPGPQQNNIDLREFSFGFQSALDPYSNAKVFVSFGEEGIGIEEAYGYWTGLPGGFRVDVGRFRQQLGELNRWHLHGLPETEYPLVIREYFSDEGVVGNGLGLYWVPPFQSVGGAVHELWAQTTLGDNEVLFDGSSRLSFLGHLNNFWQLNRSTYFQIGATGLYGENPDALLKSTAFGANFRVTWRPPETALYRSFTLRGEGYAVRKRYDGVGEPRLGGFVSATFQASARIHLGGRFDYVEQLDRPDEFKWAVVPQLTYWQSEWVVLRAEWQHLSVPNLLTGRDVSDLFVIQVVWSIGPHKHETY